jgi:hypothetical protein
LGAGWIFSYSWQLHHLGKFIPQGKWQSLSDIPYPPEENTNLQERANWQTSCFYIKTFTNMTLCLRECSTFITSWNRHWVVPEKINPPLHGGHFCRSEGERGYICFW